MAPMKKVLVSLKVWSITNMISLTNLYYRMIENNDLKKNSQKDKMLQDYLIL